MVADGGMQAKAQGKRLFSKDMPHHMYPPKGQPATIAPSLRSQIADETGNPTVVPAVFLRQFHYTFLIRHPRSSVPSYYRATIPPMRDETGFDFHPAEFGYLELRDFFDYLRRQGLIGPGVAGDGQPRGEGEVSITVVDADDLLDDPEAVLRVYCAEVGLLFRPEMLQWDERSQEEARVKFEKWKPWHVDALNSTGLKARDAQVGGLWVGEGSTPFVAAH